MFKSAITALLLCHIVPADASSQAADATAAPTDAIQQARLNAAMRNTAVLRGLKNVTVTVNGLDAWMLAHSVTDASLIAAATNRLQSAGLTVVPAASAQNKNIAAPSTVPVLYIRLKNMPTPAGDSASYTMQMSLVDSVVTKRNAHELMVSVWDTVDVGRLEANMTDEVVVALNKQLDSFIRDWSHENQI